MLTMQAKVSSTGIYDAPGHDAGLDTQLLYGESFEVRTIDGEWAEGESIIDGYPGYVYLPDLRKELVSATHRVTEARAIAYTRPDFKSPVVIRLGMNAQVRVIHIEEEYAEVDGVGWLFKADLMPIDTHGHDFVLEAEKFLNTSYLWGGRDANTGIDCSALVQNALLAVGESVPRNSGPLSRSLGTELKPRENRSLRRGDLVFWPRHVGIMLSEGQLLHATIHHRRVVSEPLSDVVALRKGYGSEITAIRRLPWYPA